MDLLLQWRYGVGPARLTQKALAIEASERRKKLREAIAASPNPGMMGPTSHRARLSVVFDAFLEEFNSTELKEEKKFIVWQALVEAQICGEKEAVRDSGRGHPRPVRPDKVSMAMRSTWEAMRAGGEQIGLAFENFMDTYHLKMIPGDSGLRGDLARVRDRVLGSWRRRLERRTKLTRAQYPIVAQAEARKYDAAADTRFIPATRRGPVPAEASGGPPPATSGGPKPTDFMAERPEGSGARPKTRRTA